MQHMEKVKVVPSYLKNVILKANRYSVEKMGHVPLFKGIRLLLNFPEPVKLQYPSPIFHQNYGVWRIVHM